MEIFRIIAILCLFATQLQANPLPTPQALTFEDLGNEFDKVLKIQKEDQTFKDGLKVIGETIDDMIDHPIETLDQTFKEVADKIEETLDDPIEKVDEVTKDFFQTVYDFAENAYNKIKNGLVSLFG